MDYINKPAWDNNYPADIDPIMICAAHKDLSIGTRQLANRSRWDGRAGLFEAMTGSMSADLSHAARIIDMLQKQIDDFKAPH